MSQTEINERRMKYCSLPKSFQYLNELAEMLNTMIAHKSTIASFILENRPPHSLNPTTTANVPITNLFRQGWNQNLGTRA